MKPSIMRTIFIYMLVFAGIIVLTIALATQVFLPSYYENRQLERIASARERLESAQRAGDSDALYEEMAALQETLGGALYTYNDREGVQGIGAGKGRGHGSGVHAERFVPAGDLTEYRYVNKQGLEIQVLGVRMPASYLVYEVSIQTLSGAAGAMMDFMWGLLIVVVLLASVIALILSRALANPIRALNALARDMKRKTATARRVTRRGDEIGELNQTLNALYEELLGNIYQLESELHKERNAEQLKKRFLAQATHELKTPIAVIRGYAEIVYDGMYADVAERDRYLKNIYEESEALSHLILDVLDYTKMETGNYHLSKGRVHINAFLREVAERYADFVRAQGFEFELHMDVPEDLEMSIDAQRIEQVYKNLIGNAVDYAKTRILTTVECVGDRVRLSLFNDGAPISDADMPNVFDSFYKQQGKQKGSGLGLAIVKEIVLLHGGEYRACNHPEGVEFVILI